MGIPTRLQRLENGVIKRLGPMASMAWEFSEDYVLLVSQCDELGVVGTHDHQRCEVVDELSQCVE